MNAIEVDGTTMSSHDKPCISCRKRKIKCDRSRPCANCTRSKQLCTYENSDAVKGEFLASSSDGDLRERLARLEAMMAAMLTKDSVEGRSQEGINQSALKSRPTINPIPTTTPPQSQSLIGNSSGDLPNLVSSRNVVGQILFQDGYSAYYDSDFWPFLINEIEDVRGLFCPARPDVNSSSWPLLSQPSLSLPLIHPTLNESNALCRLFFERVHPFVSMIHQVLFQRELNRYRRGTYHLPEHFEALLLCLYLLTINSLRPDAVEEIFFTPKEEVIERFIQSAQAALTRIDFVRTEKVHGLGALLYYVTFLFQRNSYKDAVTLLGVAANIGRGQGMHRDPSHFPFSPWVCNIRRRLWNHLCCLDGMAVQFYGAESCLPARTDARPHQNANDGDWQASRFGKPGCTPLDEHGFKDTTFALVNKAISDTVRKLAGLDAEEYEKKECLIRDDETMIVRKYLRNIDRSNPRQTVVMAFMEIRFAALRLVLQYRQTDKMKTKPMDRGRHRSFISAIELLEAFHYHCDTFAALNWEWVFQSMIPWLAIAIVLTEIPHATQQSDKTRASKQINQMFTVFSNPSMPVAKTQMWNVLVQLLQNMENSHLEPNLNTVIAKDNPPVDSMFSDDLMLDLESATAEYNDLMLQDINGSPLW